MPLTSPLSRTIPHALVAGIFAASLSAQQPTHYRVQRDTLYYRVENPFRMYWMNGADTIGPSVREVAVESHVWSGSDNSPAVRVSNQQVDVNRSSKVTAYQLSPSGRVTTLDGAAPRPGGRVDLLVPLPEQPLRVGARWTDTTSSGHGKGTVGEELDEAIRTFEVTRLFDTLRTRVAEVKGTGSWHMQLSFWVDSAAGRASWLDVQGPMEEDDFIDVGNGRLVQKSWNMDLRGRGVPPSGNADTVAAGLLSKETMRLEDSPRVRFLMRPLPGTDTSITLDLERDAPILLHTEGREANGLVATLSRNDGMVGVARASFEHDTLTSYRAMWSADSGTGMVEQTLTREGTRLRVRRTGARDTVLVVPKGVWGVADYAMQSLLAPQLLAVPRDGAAHPISVYRPYPGHWDLGRAAVQERAGLLLVTLRFADDAPEVLVLTPEGGILYGENSEPAKTKRIPLGTTRQERLRNFLAALNASH